MYSCQVDLPSGFPSQHCAGRTVPAELARTAVPAELASDNDQVASLQIYVQIARQPFGHAAAIRRMGHALLSPRRFESADRIRMRGS
eukprot:SAG31_NODE_1719_length_7455_cov_7.529772_1_plen_87_part_00